MAGVPGRVVTLSPEQRDPLGARRRHPTVQPSRDLVDRVGGHHAICRVLAARHHHQTRRRMANDMLARQRRCCLALACQQWSQPGIDALDVLPRQRGDQHRVDVVKDVVDIAAAGGGVCLVQRPVGVGGADDPVPTPGDDEQHGRRGTQDQAALGLDPVPRHDQVDTLAGPDPELPPLAHHRLGLVGPDAGSVENLLGTNLEVLSRLQIADPDSGDALALADETRDARTVCGQRAVRHGSADQEHRMARVVDLGVVVLDPADQ